MPELTPQFIFERHLPDRIAERADIAQRINAVIHFDIHGANGGKWTIDCRKQKDWITTGAHGIPQLTISVSDEDFVRIHNKTLNPQVAGLTRRVRFKPMSLQLMTELGRLLF